jgi:tight adherence protein B
LPAQPRRVLVDALTAADVDIEPEQALELWAIAASCVVVMGAALTPGFVVPACAAVLGGPLVGLRLARGRRERQFAIALPRALEQVAAELRGGGTVNGAVARLAEGDDAVAPDLRRVRLRTELGLPLGDALDGWPLDHDAPGVRAAAGALSVAASMGGRSADALDGLAASLRHRLDAAAEAHALSAQGRLSAVVVGAAPLGYLVFASIVDPHSVTALVTNDVGRVCLVVGLGLEALAGWWIRRIVSSEVA